MFYTYEKHYKSQRPDGRIMSTDAAFLENLRRTPQLLALPKELTKESFEAWRAELRAKAVELLHMPSFPPQPDPVLLSTVQRDGYRVEKWEFYPDDVCVVPVLLLVPDSASAQAPAPIVFCFPGSNQSKELFAGEPLLSYPSCNNSSKYPERNCMGKYYAQNGMIAAVFDPIGIGETALSLDDPNFGWNPRNHFAFGALSAGYSHTGFCVQQKLAFWNYAKTLPYVDENRLAVSGHSLGSETAIYMALACDDVKAVVFNDFLSNPAVRYCNHTEWESDAKSLDLVSYFHVIPGEFLYYGFEDLCAAVAPRYLCLNEGGADEYTEDVFRAYAAVGAEDHFLLTHYPVYTDPASRTHPEPMPDHGMSIESYFEHSYVNAPDHSFRAEPSLKLLRRAFDLK